MLMYVTLPTCLCGFAKEAMSQYFSSMPLYFADMPKYIAEEAMLQHITGCAREVGHTGRQVMCSPGSEMRTWL